MAKKANSPKFKPLKPGSKHGPSAYTLNAGTNVEIRQHGERKWKHHRMRRTVSMRTTKRIRDTIYMEYLAFEVRYTNPSLVTDKRFRRY